VFPHLGSTDIPFSSYPLKAKYVELVGKDKGYNSSHAYCQVKGWSKKSCEIFSNDFRKGFWNGMMEGKKMGSYKKDFEVAIFFSSQNIDFPFLFEETLGAFLFSFFFSLYFFQYFFSLFSMLRLFKDLGILMINKEKSTLQKFLLRWNGMEWLSLDYGNGGVVDISAVDAYFKIELHTPILLGEASKNFGWQIIFKKI
jgi:hypothetical protein